MKKYDNLQEDFYKSYHLTEKEENRSIIEKKRSYFVLISAVIFYMVIFSQSVTGQTDNSKNEQGIILKLMTYNLNGVYPSDHKPIIVEFEIQNK